MKEDRLIEAKQAIAKELNVNITHIKQVIQLVEEGNTIPFIARYRKEMTGNLDEIQIHKIIEKWSYANQLYERQEEVIRLIAEQGKLTAELQDKILKAKQLQELEDLYRPFRQKRRTRATVAKEKGLEPLATWLFSFPKEGSVNEMASTYLSEDHELHTIEDVIQGAQDIIAEWISDDAEIRKRIRNISFQQGKV